MENASLVRAAENHGSPLYIYDGNQMMENYEKFTNAFKVDQLKVHYACKALNNQAILKLFKSMKGWNLSVLALLHSIGTWKS